MKILAIETSCDETAVCLLEANGSITDTRYHIQGNALYSQAKKHATFGGVYPSLAKREHAENLVPLLKVALSEAHLFIQTKTPFTTETLAFVRATLTREEHLMQAILETLPHITRPPIDAIAVTIGPGLEPALWVGVNFARVLAHIWNIPIIPVNHLEGHLVASAVHGNPNTPSEYKLQPLTFPIIGLVLSGGHTEFVHIHNWGTYTALGSTRDDSVGEAYDKVARLLGIPYPGGQELSYLAERGRPQLYKNDVTHARHPYPRPMIASGDLDFSFSGLKTAVKYHIQSLGDAVDDTVRIRIATEFEEAVAEVIVTKTLHALEQHSVHAFLLGGGVSANTYLRTRIEHALTKNGITLHSPARGLSTDNAVMIGMAGYLCHLRGAHMYTSLDEIRAHGTLSL